MPRLRLYGYAEAEVDILSGLNKEVQPNSAMQWEIVLTEEESAQFVQSDIITAYSGGNELSALVPVIPDSPAVSITNGGITLDDENLTVTFAATGTFSSNLRIDLLGQHEDINNGEIFDAAIGVLPGAGQISANVDIPANGKPLAVWLTIFNINDPAAPPADRVTAATATYTSASGVTTPPDGNGTLNASIVLANGSAAPLNAYPYTLAIQIKGEYPLKIYDDQGAQAELMRIHPNANDATKNSNDTWAISFDTGREPDAGVTNLVVL